MALFDTIRAGSSGATDFEVQRSLRFNDNDSVYLNRTPSSTSNRKTFTISLWFKRGVIDNGGVPQALYGAYDNSTSGNDSYYFSASIDSGDILAVGAWSQNWRVTSRRFSDPNAWYHLVVAIDTTQSTADNRVRIYVNGTEETEFSTKNNPSQNFDLGWNFNAQMHTFGRVNYTSGTGPYHYDGYIAEVNSIDGLQLTPSSFGETDATTGQWNPIDTSSLTFGTNGFRLKFADNSGTTATTLGKDSSGNGNNFTPNNFSVSAGTGNDSLEDTPTNNFSTLNPLAGYETHFEESSNGNLDFSLSHGEFGFSSFEIPTSGKWYAEVVFTTFASGRCGITNLVQKNDSKWNGIDNLGGEIRVDDSVVQSGISNTIGNNKIVGIKVDRDAGTIDWTVDGSATGTAVNISSMSDPNNLVFAVGRNSSSGSAPTGSINFGQRPFSHLPTGYKALNSQNLPEPTVPKGNKYFDTLTWSGNSTKDTNITGLNFSPDWVWIKCRSHSVYAGNLKFHHVVWDTVRGVGLDTAAVSSRKELTISSTFPEGSAVNLTNYYGHVSAFNSDGFTLDHITGQPALFTNQSGRTYVGWCWDAGDSTVTNNDGTISTQVRANTTAGFSIATWTSDGQGSPTSLGHGLGVRPDFLIIKNRTGSNGNWQIWSPTFTNATNNFISLNLNDGTQTAGAAMWGTMDSTVVNFRHSANSTNGNTMIGYFFSNVEGFSKSGKYTGNGNSDGTFVYTGFRPAWVMIKRTDANNDWPIADNKRNPDNLVDIAMYANLTNSDNTTDRYDFLANGFKIKNNLNESNASGGSYLYLAFAESAFKYARAR